MSFEGDQREGGAEASSGPQGLHRIFKPGESYGDYKVMRCITSGLLANYYQMQDALSLQEVTVGVFHSRTMEDPRFLKRLGTLRKTLSEFDREGIPKILECAVINGQHCIVTELVRGVSLSRFFATHRNSSNGSMDPEDAVEILARVLGILGYAHAKGIEHLDLDSDLILINKEDFVQVLGLGVKAAIGRDLFESIVSASVSPLVSAKTVGRLNSFDMISPEYREGRPETKVVDLFAVGMIGYWLLTARKASLKEYVAPSEFIEGLPVEWDVFIGKMVQRKPEDRYPFCKGALIGLRGIYKDAGSDSSKLGLIQRQIDRIPVPKGISARGKVATRIYRLSIIGLVGLTLTALTATFFVETFTETDEYSKRVAMRVEPGSEPDLRIRLQPPFAKVVFKNTDTRFILSEGSLDLKVQKGSHTLELSAANHLPRTVEVDITRKEVQDLRVSLRPKWSDLSVLSNPETTVLAINREGVETELGTTDTNGVLNLETGVFSGTYTLVFQKPGYETLRMEGQDLKFDQATEIQADLVALPSSVTIQSNPEGAAIVVGGIVLGHTPVRIANLKKDELYTFTLRKKGYRNQERAIKLEAGENLKLGSIELVPKAGRVNLDIDFSGEPTDTLDSLKEALVIELDGNTYAYNSSRLDNVLEGAHTIRLVHPIYVSEVVEFTVEDDETKSLDITLTQLPGAVVVDLDPSFDPVFLVNGVVVKTTGNLLPITPGRPANVMVRIRDHITEQRTFNLEPKERQVWELSPVKIPGPELREDWEVPYLGMRFMWVPEGSYLMGSLKEEHGRLPNEGPETSVTFTRGFWAGQYEVTQAQYYSIMSTNPSEGEGSRLPVDSVNVEAAKLFCERLTDIENAAGRLPEGYVYRLPTEPEWEYAARAGSTDPFHFGDTANATNANFQGVYPREKYEDLAKNTLYGTIAVGSYAPNDWGLYDVHGNVQEWTLDRYNGRLIGDEVTDPQPRTAGTRYAVRGGSWEDSTVRARAAFRRDIRPETESGALGFRVVLGPKF